MEITRRGLFRLLAGAAAEPIARKYFLAPAGGWRPYVSYRVVFAVGKVEPRTRKIQYFHPGFIETLKAETALLLPGDLKFIPTSSDLLVGFDVPALTPEAAKRIFRRC